jgi:hypothetical protein
LVVIDHFAADYRGLHLLGSQREASGLPDQIALDLADGTADLVFVGAADVAKPPSGSGATVYALKKA